LFDPDRFASMRTIVKDRSGREHLLLSDGFRTLRLDVLAGTVGSGPSRLQYLLGGFASADAPLMTLRRLLALHRTGRLSRSLHAPESRARRWILVLRARDALASGADQREIAAALVGRAAREPRWRSQTPSLRAQAQRLVRAARAMSRNGHLEFLA
jgi:hypothetical protein